MSNISADRAQLLKQRTTVVAACHKHKSDVSLALSIILRTSSAAKGALGTGLLAHTKCMPWMTRFSLGLSNGVDKPCYGAVHGRNRPLSVGQVGEEGFQMIGFSREGRPFAFGCEFGPLVPAALVFALRPCGNAFAGVQVPWAHRGRE
jgi:hypothetical protein